MQVLITYLAYQTFSPLIVGSFLEGILRGDFENNVDMKATVGEIIYI